MAGLAAMATAACGSDGVHLGVTVRDSAGVRIWENGDKAWPDGEAWSLSSTPSITLGAVEGGGPLAFGRIADVATVGADRIAVVDALANEVRVFTRAGIHQGTIGRSGRGPGEFLSASSVQVLGDTLAVFDRGLRRLSRFRLTGELLDERALGQLEYDGQLAFIDQAALLPGGSIATREVRDFSGEGDGVTRDTTHFLIAAPEHDEAVVVDSFPGVWTLRTTYRGRQLFRFQPLTPYPHFAVRADTLYLSSGEHFEFRRATRGGLAGIVRRRIADPSLAATDRTRFIDVTLERVPEEDQAEVRQLLQGMEFPERLPAYRKILVDPDGNVWVERYTSPGFLPGPEWDVFTAGGEYLGAVANRDGLDWFEVGRDYVLGVWTDAMDVQHVRLYQLNK